MDPVRTCVACGRKAPKGALLRYAVVGGVLTRDPDGRLPGRGAYTCPERACFERAVVRRRFARTLRAAVEVPADLQAVSEEG
jgi:predicted RNA-binding protein YlxR (DUF448 family)